ncbi:uncharacterized protein LOC126572136 [Anopheles aquasalis]|uniref:uncharacterized protein LOC126572136 n=1 Tax=Anopheles aquasalis TaxID=42839 RepID=UPI00215B5823|nr:uncharacterized protein LOC126572136 [Anopheles aquasalis]
MSCPRLLVLVLVMTSLSSLLMLQSDARFLEISKQPSNVPVGIVPRDDYGEAVQLHTPPQDLQDPADQLDREKGNEMISVKLLNQYLTRPFAHGPDHLDDGDHDEGVDRETFLDDVRQPPLTELGYETVNQLDLGDVESLKGRQLPASNAEPLPPVHIKENGIEDEFLINDKTAIDQQLVKGKWMDPVDSKPDTESSTGRQDDLDDGKRSPITGNRSIAASTDTMTTMTTTRTVQSSTITVRKIRRKLRRKFYTTSSPSTVETEGPLATSPSTVTSEPESTSTSSIKPVAQPRIDINKLNLQHLEDEFLAYPAFGRMHPSRSVSRFRPRSMKRSTDPAASGTCSCRQSRKRRARKINYSYDVGGDDDDENDLNDSGPAYGYGDYNDLRRSSADVAHLFPVVSHLLAQEENGENSMERAQMVHGALERLMGIVTIFSHVDELIQRRTKKSIRRLARLYESDEMY